MMPVVVLISCESVKGGLFSLWVAQHTGGSKAKKMKLTVKGGAAVDPDSGRHKFPRLQI